MTDTDPWWLTRHEIKTGLNQATAHLRAYRDNHAKHPNTRSRATRIIKDLEILKRDATTLGDHDREPHVAGVADE